MTTTQSTTNTTTKTADEIQAGDVIAPYVLTDGTPLGWETVTGSSLADFGMVSDLWIEMGDQFRKCYSRNDLILVRA